MLLWEQTDPLKPPSLIGEEEEDLSLFLPCSLILYFSGFPWFGRKAHVIEGGTWTKNDVFFGERRKKSSSDCQVLKSISLVHFKPLNITKIHQNMMRPKPFSYQGVGKKLLWDFRGTGGSNHVWVSSPAIIGPHFPEKKSFFLSKWPETTLTIRSTQTTVFRASLQLLIASNIIDVFAPYDLARPESLSQRRKTVKTPIHHLNGFFRSWSFADQNFKTFCVLLYYAWARGNVNIGKLDCVVQDLWTSP